MKTLDEVINELEDEGLFADALHYLKEYKANREDPDGDHQQLKKCRALLQDFYRNDPLSWDELKQMEGKPVWVEVLDDTGDHYKWRGDGWYIVKDFSQGYYGGYCHLEPNYRTWTEKTYSDLWQAYRKERE